MVWPFRTFLVGNSDAKVAAALRTVAPHLSERKVDHLFSQMFAEATKLLQQPATVTGINSPVILLTVLHRNRPVRLWTRTIRGYHFTMLFLIIRAARENWFLTPQLPGDINTQPCKLARAIDEFNKVDTLDWGSAYIMQHLDWLQGRGGRILSMEIERGEDDVMGDYPVTHAGQALATTVEVCMDNDVDMMIDGVQELAIEQQ
jgi:hypothetical protein